MLREATVSKNDEDILMLIGGKDCVAIEAHYHRQCYYNYINVLVKKEVTTREIYKTSFYRFVNILWKIESFTKVELCISMIYSNYLSRQ